MKFWRFFYLALALGLSACTRPESSSDFSNIQIRTPEKGSLNEKLSAQGQALPTSKKVCYGISVKGAGIASTSNSCFGTLGTRSGFVSEGEVLSVQVAKGENRTFELFVYLAELGGTCPAWNEAFDANLLGYKKTYLSGVSSGVSIKEAEETVTLNLEFPGEAITVASQNTASACVGNNSGTLRGTLHSDGSLVSASNPEAVSFFHGVLAAFFELIPNNFVPSNFQTVSSSGVINIATGTVSIPAYLRSLTKKPDTGALFALDNEGHILTVDPLTGVPSLTTSCPFDATDCKVPAWIQSISAGQGTALFALDHSGTIYLVEGSELTPTGTTVLPSVVQVSYY